MSTTEAVQSPLVLRPLSADDEAQAVEAQVELARDGFEFLLFRDEDESWSSYVARLDQERMGIDLPAGRVPSTFLVAAVGAALVGRASIRHELNEYLAMFGGHIGYAVRPAFRRRGYARSILQQSLEVAREIGLQRVLITCDESNQASAALIESSGGLLESVVTEWGSSRKRRYWIDLVPLTR